MGLSPISGCVPWREETLKGYIVSRKCTLGVYCMHCIYASGPLQARLALLLFRLCCVRFVLVGLLCFSPCHAHRVSYTIPGHELALRDSADMNLLYTLVLSLKRHAVVFVSSCTICFQSLTVCSSNVPRNKDHRINTEDFEKLLDSPVAINALGEVGVDVAALGLYNYRSCSSTGPWPIKAKGLLQCVEVVSLHG